MTILFQKVVSKAESSHRKFQDMEAAAEVFQMGDRGAEGVRYTSQKINQ